MNVKAGAVTSKQLRDFGLIVGGILAVIGLWPWLLRGEDPRLWALAVAALLVVPALVAPGVLKPIYRIWMRIGSVLGWVNTRIILALGFYGVFTPMATAMRLFGRDALQRKFEGDVASYRVKRSVRPVAHMRRPF